MRVVLTRPAGDANDWARGLQVAGHEVVLLPLIVIGSAPDPALIGRYWERLTEFQAVMFVSANAVRGFFAGKPEGSGAETQPGDGTRQALLAKGLLADLIDSPPVESAQFDSEALWQQVRAQIKPGVKILIVRGAGGAEQGSVADGSGRDWLSDQLAAAGAFVAYCVAYRRARPEFTALQREQVKHWVGAAQAGRTVWLFSSSEAITNLAEAFPGQSWQQTEAVCTHPRIAERARRCGFGVVGESRPTLSDVVASIESTG
jgi:uroporphyrinogen-III synthase